MHKHIEGFRLSPQQARLWLAQRDGRDYFAQCAILLEGRLQTELLRQALQRVVSRHDILRTTFHRSPGIKLPIQVVNEQSALLWLTVDATTLDASEQPPRLEELLSQERGRAFNFDKGPLMRLTLVALSAERHALLVSLPALCADGWSLKNIVGEIARAYDEASQQANATAVAASIDKASDEDETEETDEPTQYVQFSEWQSQVLNTVDAANGRAYWNGVEAASGGELHLPLESESEDAARGRQKCFALDVRADVAARVAEVAEKYDTTPACVLLACWQTLLWRLTGRAEFVVKNLFDGRKYEELYDGLGLFAQFLPVGARFDEALTFAEVLRRAGENLREAVGWQEYFSDEERIETEAALASAIGFEYEEFPAPLSAGGVNFSIQGWHVCFEPFKLKLACRAGAGALRAEFKYISEAFTTEEIERLSGQFAELLANAVAQPETSVAELEILGEAERRALLSEFNATAQDYPKERLLHELFEQQAARTPDAVAVSFGEQRLSYAELDERANQLAQHLRRLRVAPEVLVGICMERAPEMLVAVLGVLKAGGAYLPLDPAYPQERLAFMLRDAGVKVLLTQQRLVKSLPGHAVQLVCLDTDWPLISAESAPALLSEAPNGKAPRSEAASSEATNGEAASSEVTPENLAYVIYTSGSTGQPKGVAITHRGVVNYLSWCTKAYRVAEGGGAPVHSPLGFDLTVTSIFSPLMTGGRVLLVEEAAGVEGLSAALNGEGGFSLVKITPSHLEVLAQLLDAEGADAQTRALIIGGEALWANSLGFWRQHAPQTRLINEYGPTETVVGCCVYEVEAGRDLKGAVPIGRPIANTQLYVLNAALRPVATGVTGELYIGGDGVGRGYLNRPELTAERFIPDLFSGEPGARLYRTGDLARHLADGQLEYVGRVDSQVKVRGFRIELGEIEAVLSQSAHVREAVVLSREAAGGDMRLVAYIVPQQKPAPTVEELRGFLLDRLPEYMVPSSFVVLDRMPLTSNGKIDVRALPAPDSVRPDLRETYDRPRSTVEYVLAAIWSEVLGVKQVGVHDNYFALGGDSIRSVRVLALAKERGLNFTLQDIFKHQTIYALAREIRRDEDAFTSLRTEPFALVSEEDRRKLPEGLEDAYPLSRMQLGMIYHMELTPDSPSYHNVSSYQLRVKLDEELLQEAAQRVVNRHPVLRTLFDLTTYSEPLQLVQPTAHMPLPVIDISHLSPDEQERELVAFVESEWRRPFDLSRPPLVRFFLHRRGEDDYQFTVTECHAVVDGWSITSTFAEVFSTHFELLENRALPLKPPPAVTFRDYIYSERKALESVECREFWTEKLRESTSLRLPRRQRAERAASLPRIRKVPIPISMERSESLRRLANNLAVPIKSVMLAAHLKALSVVTGERDILTGLAANGRPEELDGEEVRGLYVLTSPLRMSVEDGTWADLIRQTFQSEWELLPYRLYPMAALQKSAGMRALLETEFHYLHFHSVADLLHSGRMEILGNIDLSETNFTIMVGCQMNPLTSELTLDLHCDMTELSDEQVETIAGYYDRALDSMLEDPQRKHHSVSLLSEQEQRQLAGWSAAAEAPATQARCIPELVEEQCARTPDAPAVVSGDDTLSYRELNERANQLARHLRTLGVAPEFPVGLCMNRSAGMVVALLGILKAGGTYLPLDPAYPQERLAFMLEDTGARVLITEQPLLLDLPTRAAASEVVCLDAEWDTIAQQATDNLEQNVTPDNLAYIIYTSGSTGTPKGVGISHGAASSHLATVRQAYALSPADRVLQFASLNFDVSLEQLLAPLCSGATLVLRDEETLDGREFLAQVAAQRLTVVNLPPAYWSQLTQELSAASQTAADAAAFVRLMNVGGDAMPLEAVRRWQQSPLATARLLNAYGPTETTITATLFDVPPRFTETVITQALTSVPIGRGLGARTLYVLDRSGQLAAVGARGELHIGGSLLARGYHGRAELTAERFVPDSFSTEAGARMYATGDEVRWREDGVLEFLGRRDEQVKVRGYRIELGEVERAIGEQAEWVRECVAAVKADESGEKRLVAYVVMQAGQALSVTELRSLLKKRLPQHMIPSVFVTLEALPLTPNGKVDKRALPEPDAARPELSETFVAARNETEAVLCQVWAEVLGVERVGVHDHFLELGGDSLLATQLISKVRTLFEVEIPLRNLLTTPTVAGLAESIESARSAEQDELEKLASMLDGLEQLSEEEARRLLDAKSPARASHD